MFSHLNFDITSIFMSERDFANVSYIQGIHGYESPVVYIAQCVNLN